MSKSVSIHTSPSPPAEDIPPRRRLEYQAIILGGGDVSRLYPLVVSENQCVSLLTINNRPLIYYQLNLLEKYGFSECFLVVEDKFKKQIKDCISKGNFQIKVELFHPEQTDSWQTATILKELSPKLFADFLVLPGDLVAEISIRDLADVHRTRDSTVTVLLKENEPIDLRTSSSKPVLFSYAAAQLEEVKTFFGLQRSGQHTSDYRIVLSKPSSERQDGSCLVGRHLLDKCERFILYSTLSDAHVYLFKHWVLDLIEEYSFESIQDDVLPFLISNQFNTEFAETHPEIWSKARSPQALAQSMSSATWIAPNDSDRIRIYSYLSPFKKGGSSFCARANTIQSYSWIHFAILENGLNDNTPWEPFVSQPYNIQEEVEIASSKSGSEKAPRLPHKTLFGSSCTVNSSSKLSSCIIGDGCYIGAGVEMTNCLLLANCRIEDFSKLENCLLGTNVVVQPKCRLVKCTIGPKYTVKEGTVVKDSMHSLLVDSDELLNDEE